MAPPGVTWWAGPGPRLSYSGQTPQPPPGPRPPAPMPSVPVPPAPVPPAQVAKPQQGPTTGAIALGLGVVLLIAGPASHTFILVIIGLIAGAWGLWRLVTLTGKDQEPPRRPG